jgi:hypothetical protein
MNMQIEVIRQHSLEPKRHQRVLPIWAPILVGFVLIVAAVLFVAWDFRLLRSDKAKLQRQIEDLQNRQTRAEIEQKAAEEQAKLTIARNRQQEAIAIVRKSTNALQILFSMTQDAESQLASLQTNKTGEALSPYPELVAQAQRLYEDARAGLPSLPEVEAKLEEARRVEIQLVSESGTAFNPDGSLLSVSQDALVWSEARRITADQIAARIRSLSREPATKGAPAKPFSRVTLAEAMQRLAAEQAERHNEVVTEKTAEAKEEATKLEAKAVSNRILAVAESKKVQADVDTHKIEFDTKTRVLREKASRADVQQQLATFLTPGYWVPAGINGQFSYEKRPMSLSKLTAMNALDPSVRGLIALVQIGCHHLNDRPHLSREFSYNTWFTNPARLEAAKKMQQLLVELGPTFVEMQLMDP